RRRPRRHPGRPHRVADRRVPAGRGAVAGQQLRTRGAVRADVPDPARETVRTLRHQGGRTGMTTLLRSAPSTKARTSTGVRGRPLLRTSYEQDLALANTPAKRRSMIGLIVASFVVPFLLTDDLLQVLTLGMISAVGAIGLNLVTGY